MSFVLSQGVRQGGTLSPLLYTLCVDELLVILTAQEGQHVKLSNASKKALFPDSRAEAIAS